MALRELPHSAAERGTGQDVSPTARLVGAVGPSQLSRAWRTAVFAREHQRARARWAKTDRERGVASLEAIRLTWVLIDLDAERRLTHFQGDSDTLPLDRNCPLLLGQAAAV